MLSSAKTQDRLNDASAAIDKRTNGSKRRSEAIMEKPQNALRLLDNAKQEFAAQLEATAAEAAQALEEAQIDLQTMRDSLAQAEESREQSAQLVGLAENISAEAAAKNELLQQTLADQTRAYQQELAQASDKALIERTHYEAKTNELEELLQHSSVQLLEIQAQFDIQ